VSVAYACNPSYLGGWDQEDSYLRPVWKNSSKTFIITGSVLAWACHPKLGGKLRSGESWFWASLCFSTEKSWLYWCVPVITVMVVNSKYEDCGPSWRQIARPWLQNNQRKRPGGIAQAVRYLPTKHEAPNLNNSTKRKKKKGWGSCRYWVSFCSYLSINLLIY
jgi:hypothetical protein